MLPKVRTLRKRDEFLRLKAEGARVSNTAFVLQYLEDKEETGVAVGYTASTKSIGNAVARNRAKRRLKACFDKLFRCNPQAAGAGRMLAWIAKAPVLTMDFKQLEADMQAALRKAGLQG